MQITSHFVGKSLAVTTIIGVLMYCRFIILAAAVAFAFVWVTTSPRETPKKKKKISVESECDPVLDSFWKELESSTPCSPEDSMAMPSSARVAGQHGGASQNQNQTTSRPTHENATLGSATGGAGGSATSSSRGEPGGVTKSAEEKVGMKCDSDEEDEGADDDDNTTAPKSRFTNGSWADEPDEDNLDFLPTPALHTANRRGKQHGNASKKDATHASSIQGKGPINGAHTAQTHTAQGSHDQGEGAEEKPKVHRVNPRQVYVGGLPFKTTEQEIQEFFSSSCGSIELVKLLKHPDGKSRGVAFVTFTAVESAHTALQFHDQDYEGRLLTVRITNPDQNKPAAEKKKWPNNPNMRNQNNPATDAASRAGRLELDKLLQQTIEETPLTMADFDFQARKMLLTLLKRSPERCEECLAVIKHFTASKERDSVRNWRGYVYTLLHKHEPELAEELRGKRGGGGHAQEERLKMQ